MTMIKVNMLAKHTHTHMSHLHYKATFAMFHMSIYIYMAVSEHITSFNMAYHRLYVHLESHNCSHVTFIPMIMKNSKNKMSSINVLACIPHIECYNITVIITHLSTCTFMFFMFFISFSKCDLSSC